MDDDLAALVKEDTREKMGKAIDHVRHEMGNVRTGRASSALIETLLVDYYGTPTPLRQLAGFSVPDAMLLVISPMTRGRWVRSRRPSWLRTWVSTPPTTAP